MRNKTLGLLIIISFFIRSVFALATELNNDEVYYWTYAQKLQWNYFDHPPGIAVLLKIFTANLLLQHEFFLRLGSMVCAAVSTGLIYLIGKKIKNKFTGLVAAFLFTASPYCSLIAGLLIIPDAPQLVCWLWSVLLMLKIIEPLQRKQKLQRRLLLLGFAIGGCIMCKVHGVFLWAGFLSYIIFYQRRLLLNPFLFYAGCITVAMVSPIVFWNISNDFISYRYHSNRVSFFSTIHADGFLRELVGEIIYNNPVSFVLLVLTLIAVMKNQIFIGRPAQRLLLFISFPLMAVVLLMSVFNDTLPHWTGPAYATLIPLVAAYLVSKQKSTQNIVPAPVKWALVFTAGLLIPAFIAIKWLPYNLGNKKWQELGAGDPTLDMNGFKKFGAQLDSLCEREIQKRQTNKNLFLLSDYWFPAAHIDYYAARPGKINFIAMGDLPAIHHYAWLNKERPSLQQGDDAWFIAVSNYFKPPSPKLQEQFEKMANPITITQYRGGVAVRIFFIYRLSNYKGSTLTGSVYY